MNFLKKNKIAVIVVGVLLVVGLAVYLLFGTGNNAATNQPGAVSAKPVKAITPEQIGLSLSFRADKKAIIMDITKLDGIASVEYEVTYDANVTADSSGDSASGVTQRGVVGSPIPVKSGDSDIKRTIELGTCSKNVCKYDNVVSDVKFVIKVTYSNGDIGSVEKAISL